jgi:hypothetical protein
MHLKLIPKQHYMVHYPQWIKEVWASCTHVVYAL